MSAPRSRLDRNVAVLAGATFVLALGESLWLRYAPAYLEALGAGALVIGAWGSLQDLLDAAWQVPGGVLTDKLGVKRALLLLTAASLVGLGLFLVPSWPVVLLGLVFYMAENAYAQPATFAAIGEALPGARRAGGFVAQSALKRVPALVGPPVAGWLIGTQLGVVGGVRAALAAAAAFTLVALVAQARFFAGGKPKEAPRFALRDLPRNLRRLLWSDILVRMGESATKVFVILWVVHDLGFSFLAFGVMASWQVLVMLLSYIPARWADRGRRKPWVALAFLFFALYPLSLVGARSLPLLALAFAVGGLKEIGEPARKASIVDMAPEGARGRVVGTYYALRGFAIMPVSFLAGFLWQVDPAWPFLAGGALGGAGLVLYLLAVREE